MRALPLLTLVLMTSACASTGGSAPTAAAPAVISAASTIPSLGADEIRNSHKRHAALAQYYRWYQLYENDESQLVNALDILDPEVTIKSGLGEAKGHDAYAKRVGALPKSWDNSHKVQDVNITLNPDGTTDLVANIFYLNKGMMPDGTVRSADLTYRTRLKQGAGLLPKFISLDLAQNSVGTVDSFVAAYPENRVRSLLHYWYALTDSPNRDAEPYREILADGFRLNFSGGTIDDFSKFKAWYNGPAAAVAAASHVITSFEVSELGPNTFGMKAVADWNGLLPNGEVMVGRVRLDWVVVDNPVDRFARIKSVNVEQLVPFQPRPKT